MRLNRFPSWLHLLAAGLCAAVVSSSALATEPADDPSTIIATVNGVEYPFDIFRVFFVERMQQQGNDQNTPQLQEIAFNDFLNMIVAAQDAEARNLGTMREVQAALELQRLAILSTAALQTIAEESNPSDDELQAAYANFVEQAKRTEYKARHILLDDEDKARALIKKIDRKGKNFEALAREHSLGPTKDKGGDLGWFDARQMVKPFADAVAQMKPGTFTKEPVQTQFGWHIIQLEETRIAEPPSFDEARMQLEVSLRRQKVVERLGQLREQADVVLNEDVVKMKDASADN